MMSYSFQDELNVLQTLPGSLACSFPWENSEAGTRVKVISICYVGSKRFKRIDAV
jgi:hypothetical protein